MSGDVFMYTARNISSYRENGEIAYNKLIEDAFTALDSRVDFSEYDSNGDKFIDGLVLSLPLLENAPSQGVCAPP